MTGGELFDRILAKDHYSETEAARCFVQVTHEQASQTAASSGSASAPGQLLPLRSPCFA